MRNNVQHKAFGVSKPVGHVVISFPPDILLDEVVDALEQAGFDSAEMRTYSPEAMIEQVDRDLAAASPLAAIGQELNLVKAHRALAAQGHGFVVVHAPRQEDAARVAEVARACRAVRAQHYGTFVIEELILGPHHEEQVFESPDRGLDAETLSGQEQERGHPSSSGPTATPLHR